MTFIQIEIFLEVYKTSPTLKAVTHFEALNCYKKSDTCLYKFFWGKYFVFTETWNTSLVPAQLLFPMQAVKVSVYSLFVRISAENLKKKWNVFNKNNVWKHYAAKVQDIKSTLMKMLKS